MGNKVIYAGLTAILIVLICILGCLLKYDTTPSGFIIDKYEQDDRQYVLLDNKEWVEITPEQYIGLDIGDFYE